MLLISLIKDHCVTLPRGSPALTPPCIVWKNPQVPNTARQEASHPVNTSRGKRSSMPQPKMRPDSPVPTLQGPWQRSLKWRGTLRFLPQLKMRPSSNASTQWSPERPLSLPVSLTYQSHHEKPPEVTCTIRGNPGFPASTRERPWETSFNTSRGQIRLP